MSDLLVTLANHLNIDRKDLITQEQIERFNARLLDADENHCILWAGRKDEDGGKLKINNKDLTAHRFAYMIHHGPIGEGLQVRHTCHKLLCCNKDHLYLSPPPIAKPKAPKKPRKLSPENVASIRKLRLEGKTLAELAALFSVTQPAICQIVNNKTHTKVPHTPETQPQQLT